MKNQQESALAFEKWNTEETRRNGIRSLANLIEQLKPERNLLETHFVNSSDVVPFLDTIEALAKAAGGKTEISSVNIAQDGSSLKVDLKASGSFEAIYKFIMLLEDSPYYLKFVSADIKSSVSNDPNNNSREWTASLQIDLISFSN